MYNTFHHLGGIYALTPYPFVWSADGSGWTPWQIACKAQRSHSGKEGVYFIAFEPSGSASQIPVVVAVRVAVSCTHRLRLLLLQRGTVALSSILHRRVPTQVAHLPSLHGGKTSESCTQRLMQVTKPSTEPASELAGYRVGQLLGIRMPKLRLLNCWTDPEGLLFVKTLHRPAAHGHAALRSQPWVPSCSLRGTRATQPRSTTQLPHKALHAVRSPQSATTPRRSGCSMRVPSSRSRETSRAQSASRPGFLSRTSWLAARCRTYATVKPAKMAWLGHIARSGLLESYTRRA